MTPVEARKKPEIILDRTIKVIAVVMVLYHMASAFYFIVGPTQHQNVHLAFALVLIFLPGLKGKPWGRLISLVLLVLSLATTAYVQLNTQWLEFNMGDPFPSLPVLIFSGLIIVLSIEGCRRAFGLVMPVVIVSFLAYGMLAHLIPGYFRAFYVAPQNVLSRLGIGSIGVTGIYGTFLGISASDIFLFVIFGSLLQATGATRFFMEVGKLAGRKLAGGAAISAVTGSALVGMVTGSVAANIVTVGSFTIPLMKKSGYTPEQAGAIEAAASTGGQIMPPVMGAAAFLMAGVIGVPYAKIMIIAAIPAILYFACIWIYAQLQGAKMNLRSPEQEVDTKELFWGAPLFLVPLAFLVVLLLQYHSIGFTMSLSIMLLIAVSLIRKKTRPSLKKLVDGFTEGAITGSQIAASCAALGVVGGIMAWRGLGVKLPEILISLSDGNLILALLLVMLSSIILGMGVPTSACYLLVALATAPALLKMGLPMLQAHFFSFYFAIVSMVTPPVALGAIIASKLSGGNYVKTGIEATKAAAAGFIVPFLFTWQPTLLLLPAPDVLWAVIGVVASITIIMALEISICNYYITEVNWIERSIFAIITLSIFISLPLHSYPLIIGGIALFLILTVVQLQKRRTLKLAQQSSTRN